MPKREEMLVVAILLIILCIVIAAMQVDSMYHIVESCVLALLLSYFGYKATKGGEGGGT